VLQQETVMAHGTRLALAEERDDSHPDVGERWPPLYSVLFVTGASIGLWAMLIGAGRWLFGLLVT
jgi:hypothetical protein